LQHSKESTRQDSYLAFAQVEEAVKRVNSSKELFEFVRNMEALNILRIDLRERKVPNPLSDDSAALDVEILGSCLRKVVSELIDSKGTCSNADISSRSAIPKDSVSLCTYYLRSIGLVSAQKQGRSLQLTLATNDIRKGAIESVILSIQGRQLALADRAGPPQLTQG